MSIETRGGDTIIVSEDNKTFGGLVEDKAERIREYRKEASRLAAIANKRVARLEKNGLENSPAYQGYLKSGGDKFSIRGKSYNEVQAEMSRLRKFIDANTSTISGVNKYLKGMAKDTGMKYKNLTELREKADTFFTLSSKVEQYLRTVEDMASAIGYQKIWESINEYVKVNKVDLTDGRLSIEEMTEKISKAIAEYENPEYVKSNPAPDGSIFGMMVELKRD